MLGILTGLFAGLLHVLSGPDHLAAIAPLAARRPRQALALGVRWGLGHSAGVLLVGVLALWLRELLPLEALSFWTERLVGVLLVGVGIWGLRQVVRRHVHDGEHEHGRRRHAHFHFHVPGGDAARARHSHAALGIGVLHGLAGGAHFIAVLPALALGHFAAGAGFLLAYGVGTILGMAGFAGSIGWLARGPRGTSWLGPVLGGASGLALVVGVWWIVA